MLAFVAHELETGVAAIERALMLNPNFAAAWLFLGWTKVWRCQPDVAIEHLERAMRLSPVGAVWLECRRQSRPRTSSPAVMMKLRHGQEDCFGNIRHLIRDYASPSQAMPRPAGPRKR